jgi:hypothetical protein
MGTVAMIKVVRMKEGTLLFARGLSRLRILEFALDRSISARALSGYPDGTQPTPALEALRRDGSAFFSR